MSGNQRGRERSVYVWNRVSASSRSNEARNRPARNVTEKSKEVKVIKKYTQARYYEKSYKMRRLHTYTHPSDPQSREYDRDPEGVGMAQQLR